MSRRPERRTRPPEKKIVGARGQWTAEVDGVEMAVLHTTHRQGLRDYFDPMEGGPVDGAKHARLVAALRAGNVAVMQRDKPGDPGLARDGYVGLFSFKDLEIGDDGSIRLTFVDRVQ